MMQPVPIFKCHRLRYFISYFEATLVISYLGYSVNNLGHFVPTRLGHFIPSYLRTSVNRYCHFVHVYLPHFLPQADGRTDRQAGRYEGG